MTNQIKRWEQLKHGLEVKGSIEGCPFAYGILFNDPDGWYLFQNIKEGSCPEGMDSDVVEFDNRFFLYSWQISRPQPAGTLSSDYFDDDFGDIIIYPLKDNKNASHKVTEVSYEGEIYREGTGVEVWQHALDHHKGQAAILEKKIANQRFFAQTYGWKA